MIPSPSIDDLSARIRERSGIDSPSSWPGPYILFLGEGCARAAGAPSRAAIAREALRLFGSEVDRPLADEPDDVVFARFARQTEQLTPGQMGRMLRSLYSQIAVPSFYQYLALLVRERYFPLIMTMNFDTLLEQALATAGTGSSEYRVTTFSSRKVATPREATGSSGPLTHIVKLHGDLAQDIAQITPDQIEDALSASRSWIKSDLKGDMIMVEHVLSDDPIDRWLGHFPQRELWWVGQEPSIDLGKVSLWATGSVNQITGEEGRPQVFFPQLALRLLRAPDQRPSTESPESSPVFTGPNVEAVQIQVTDPLADTLHNEILRNQSALYNLEQEGVSGERSTQVEAQIAYHKRQSFRLEDRLRSLPDVRSRVVDCVKRIGDRIRDQGPSVMSDSAAADSMIHFVNTQLDTLERELQKDTPNQIVVSASLGATLTLADRLLTEYGAHVVDPEDVKNLASLVPTVAGKVVL